MNNTAKKQMITKSMTMKTAVQHLAIAGLAWGMQGIAGFDSFNATTPNVQRNSAHFCQWAVQRLPQSSWPPIFGKSSTQNAAMAQKSIGAWSKDVKGSSAHICHMCIQKQ